MILSGSESFAGTLELTFHMRIGFLGGTVTFQVGLCTPLQNMPLTWMFYRRSLNNSLDHVQERSLRLIYDNFAHSFQEYLEMINQKKIYQKNMECLAKEI